jgi:hypothetical protein
MYRLSADPDSVFLVYIRFARLLSSDFYVAHLSMFSSYLSLLATDMKNAKDVPCSKVSQIQETAGYYIRASPVMLRGVFRSWLLTTFQFPLI